MSDGEAYFEETSDSYQLAQVILSSVAIVFNIGMFIVNQYKGLKINKQQKELYENVNVIKKLSKYNLQEKLNISSEMPQINLDREMRQVQSTQVPVKLISNLK